MILTKLFIFNCKLKKDDGLSHLRKSGELDTEERRDALLMWIKKVLSRCEKRLADLQHRVMERNLLGLARTQQLVNLFNPILSSLRCALIHLKDANGLVISKNLWHYTTMKLKIQYLNLTETVCICI